MTVVVQIVDVKFKAAVPDLTDIPVRDPVAFFGYDLERGPEIMREIDINQIRSKFVARPSFHVVGQDQACGRSFGPKPYEGNPVAALASHRKAEKSLVQGIDRGVYRPMWERQSLPISEVGLL